MVKIIAVLPASGGAQIVGQAIFDSDLQEAASTASLIRMGGALSLTTAYDGVNLTSVSLCSLVSEMGPAIEAPPCRPCRALPLPKLLSLAVCAGR